MKRFFSLMLVALLATAMLCVSCDKPEDDPTNTENNGGNGGNGATGDEAKNGADGFVGSDATVANSSYGHGSTSAGTMTIHTIMRTPEACTAHTIF